MARRLKGFSEIQLGICAAIFALLVGAAWLGHSWLESYARENYDRGAAAKQLEWEAADRKAEEDRRAREKAVALELVAADNAKTAAENKAAEAQQARQEAIREAKRNSVALGVCTRASSQADDRDAVGQGNRVPAGGETPRDSSGAGGIRVTWEFVRELDTAWTGLGGEPVSPLARGLEGTAGAGAPSPYGLEDVRDVAGENARRCSEDRRQLASLIDKLNKAATSWDGGQR